MALMSEEEYKVAVEAACPADLKSKIMANFNSHYEDYLAKIDYFGPEFEPKIDEVNTMGVWLKPSPV